MTDESRNKGGRPRKVRPKETPEALKLAALIAETELESVAANEAFRDEPTMANKVRLLAAEMRAATLQRAWCLLDSNHTHALRWAETAAKLSREHAAALERLAIDRAEELAQRSTRESSIARKLGGAR